MTDHSARLATLVGSRLCHDLVSPIGAISNGLELIALAGSPGPEEMELIAQSCASARARINFFRVAFGKASPEQMVGHNEAAKLITDYCEGGRMTMDWQPQTSAAREAVQIAYLAALCCETALPLGGRVQILEADGIWRISGTGRRVSVDSALWSALGNLEAPDDIAPDRVQFACLAMLVPEAGRKLTVHTGDAAVSIEIR
ncbi:hypothetical protein KO516_06170 [Citreicella sp. C3M06]|uniref:histidine phosphotransferase family protein n=1 Tax=Citreicella sp. C3M06 TaxID=2841564 RepID=UPI001C09FA48|nr:histidine phosphotransferase family protein [Citreicella sp. C3M06]MBU2960409.1 hypothetical protein [Citreicella sp. C3M06]